MTALGSNPTIVDERGEPVALPSNRSLVLEASELSTALAESPRMRLLRQAAWPLFVAFVGIGFVGAHFGRPSYVAHALAVGCLLLRLLPGIRARVALQEDPVERVSLSQEGIRVERREASDEWPWTRVSFYESSVGLVLALPGRSLPCLLARRHFTPAEYLVVLGLARARARRVGRAVDIIALSCLVLLVVSVAWWTWQLTT